MLSLQAAIQLADERNAQVNQLQCQLANVSQQVADLRGQADHLQQQRQHDLDQALEESARARQQLQQAGRLSSSSSQ